LDNPDIHPFISSPDCVVSNTDLSKDNPLNLLKAQPYQIKGIFLLLQARELQKPVTAQQIIALEWLILAFYQANLANNIA
jgi:hypothetical protein